MDKRVLFVNEAPENFLITAMEKSLESAGYEVIFAQPHPKEIKSISNLPKIFLVYLDGDETRYNATLTFFESLVKADQDNHLFLIGNPIDIENSYRIIDKDLITKAFQRPVNTSDLITQLDIACSGYSIDSTNGGVQRSFTGSEDVNKKTIMIVDDDTSFLRSMQTSLSKKFNVYITNSGLNAVDFLKERKVDLILLDYEMPILSGLETFRILRSEQMTIDIPVIFLTSKDDKKIVMRVLEGKPENYLLKPISPSILTQTVEDFFAKQARGETNKAIDPRIPIDLEDLEDDKPEEEK
ncbi:MAG: response regulator [Treponema sp.]|nr:response regulator [Treponema sp.]